MISCERIMPSMICLPSTYLECSGEMSSDKRGFNLFAMTLEMNFYMTLHRAINLDLSGVIESSSLGIRAMKVELSEGSSQ